MTDDVAVLLSKIVDEAPASMRQLARASGLSHVSLIRARQGEKRLSSQALLRVVAALRAWSEDC